VRLVRCLFARPALAAVLALLGLLLGPVAARAQEVFPQDQLRILAVFKTIDFGENAFITGQMRQVLGPDVPSQPYTGRTVTLEQSPFPFLAWTPVATDVTDHEGYYAFERRPIVNTKYRTHSDDPALMSAEKVVRVRFKLKVRVSDTTPAKGDRVEFSGSVVPAHPGGTVYIQHLLGLNFWQTVTRTKLHAKNAFSSVFSRHVRIRHNGVFRVKVESDGAHLAVNSVGRAIVVHDRPRHR
jgi:hypothetical protein